MYRLSLSHASAFFLVARSASCSEDSFYVSEMLLKPSCTSFILVTLSLLHTIHVLETHLFMLLLLRHSSFAVLPRASCTSWVPLFSTVIFFKRFLFVDHISCKSKIKFSLYYALSLRRDVNVYQTHLWLRHKPNTWCTSKTVYLFYTHINPS